MFTVSSRFVVVIVVWVVVVVDPLDVDVDVVRLDVEVVEVEMDVVVVGDVVVKVVAVAVVVVWLVKDVVVTVHAVRAIARIIKNNSNKCRFIRLLLTGQAGRIDAFHKVLLGERINPKQRQHREQSTGEHDRLVDPRLQLAHPLHLREGRFEDV